MTSREASGAFHPLRMMFRSRSFGTRGRARRRGLVHADTPTGL